MSKWNQMEIFLFLNTLRRTGEVNMFGAASWIVDYFGVTRKEAKEYLLAWMKWAEESPENLEA